MRGQCQRLGVVQVLRQVDRAREQTYRRGHVDVGEPEETGELVCEQPLVRIIGGPRLDADPGQLRTGVPIRCEPGRLSGGSQDPTRSRGHVAARWQPPPARPRP